MSDESEAFAERLDEAGRRMYGSYDDHQAGSLFATAAGRVRGDADEIEQLQARIDELEALLGAYEEPSKVEPRITWREWTRLQGMDEAAGVHDISRGPYPS